MRALLNCQKNLFIIRKYQVFNGKKLALKYGNLPLSSQQRTFAFCNHTNFHYLIARRSISSSNIFFEKSSSKIEDVVKTLKEAEKEKTTTAATELKEPLISKVDITSTDIQSKQALTPVTPDSSAVVKKTILQKIWAECVHYYHGFRLLFIDINVSRKLLWKVLNGGTLTRREHRLLIRTTSDLFRLLPFSVFIIVPFMELLLPLAIKLFPGMLPSTFESATEKETKIKQNLKVKIEMAKFLQKTLDDMTVQHKGHRSEAAKQFSEFFQRVRDDGLNITNEEIMKFAKLFEDEITLDSLSRQQLLALCRVLEVNTIGTNNLLRFQLRMKLRSLAADDRMIQKEGIDSLTLSELQIACRNRGMRAYGMSEERLRKQLIEWINLSLNAKVPPSLLLLSRALMLPENVEVGDKLKATLATLPETIATQTKANIAEREGKIDNKTKIEIIKEEQRKIKEEQDEEKEAQLEKKATEDVLHDKAPILTDSDGIKTLSLDEISNKGIETIKVQLDDKVPAEKPKDKEKELTSEDLKVLSDALGSISQNKNLLLEKEEIKEIKEEIAEYEEDVEELKQMVEQNKDEKLQLKESRAAKLLFKKVNSMINNLDKVLDDLEQKEKEIKDLIEEPVEVTEAVDAVIEEEAKRNKELVRIDEMMNAIRKIQKVSDESVLLQIEKILGRIDDDRDGSIRVEDVLKVIETIGKENVNLKENQLNEILDLIDKEEILETEEKIVKALKKEQDQKQAQIIKDNEEFTESEKKFVLQDKAEELNDQKDVKKSNDVDEKIKEAVKMQNEKILSQVDPTNTTKTTANSEKTDSSTTK
ncbi:mitochondrial proton/calcium exchanger protein [Chironomus tepperi]|uniref:mitochondrial proton/calcium exchanger protein n=1 Tax=Chironomus tepperi TaxID=113505 RepID=UPI00391F2661